LKIDYKELLKPKEFGRTLIAILGIFLYAVGLNLFIIPVGLYSGGVMGISQITRTLLVDYLKLPFNNFDIAGIIYFIINIPLFFIAFKTIGKLFFMKTLICMISMTVFLTLIPIPSYLLLTDDIITSCLIGGIISGVGSGLALMMGGSGGGLDIIGLYFIKRKGNVSIGKTSLLVNFFVYGICVFLFNVTTAIYSIIFASVSSVAMDKVHSQNIIVEVIIITRKDLSAFQTDVMNQMGRGITKWNTTGAYTKEGSEILYIVLSKYEVNHLKRLVHKYDPNAFIVVKEGVWVDGNYTKKL
jgi:uncharacterized membrane-anchored protein YitT (DUF2179 family)